MAKKGLLVLVLAGALAGGAFAQSMAVSVDLAPMMKGFIAGQDTDDVTISYFAVSPVVEFAVGNYSIGARGDLIFGSVKSTGSGKQSVDHVGLAAVGRWYPLAKLQKLYLGAEIGFATCNVEDVDDPLYEGLTFALRAGWRHAMGSVSLEPSLGYVLSKTAEQFGEFMPLTPLGWQIGLGFGIAF
jgi:hypothetical protein